MRYNAALRSERMEAVIDHIDAAATEGTIEIGTGPGPGLGTLLVVIDLDDPSFTEAAGIITMAGVPLSGNATAGGTAAVAQIKDGAGTVVIDDLTVGAGAPGSSHIILNSVIISSGQTVTLSSGTITHANNT